MIYVNLSEFELKKVLVYKMTRSKKSLNYRLMPYSYDLNSLWSIIHTLNRFSGCLSSLAIFQYFVVNYVFVSLFGFLQAIYFAEFSSLNKVFFQTENILRALTSNSFKSVKMSYMKYSRTYVTHSLTSYKKKFFKKVLCCVKYVF